MALNVQSEKCVYLFCSHLKRSSFKSLCSSHVMNLHCWPSLVPFIEWYANERKSCDSFHCRKNIDFHPQPNVLRSSLGYTQKSCDHEWEFREILTLFQCPHPQYPKWCYIVFRVGGGVNYLQFCFYRFFSLYFMQALTRAVATELISVIKQMRLEIAFLSSLQSLLTRSFFLYFSYCSSL